MFTKYSSIENSYKAKFLNKCIDNYPSELMVALEKIHGANYSFIVKDGVIQSASRNDIIPEGDSFFNHQKIVARYRDNVVALEEKVREIFPGIHHIQLFGEIFGGHYHGTNAGVSKVQAGMSYHPDIEFSPFDLKIFVGDGSKSLYATFAQLTVLLDRANSGKAHELMVPPILGIGTIQELTKIDPLFHTQVPKLFGVEDGSEKTDADFGEGFVIRGLFSDPYIGAERVILKQKNEKFNEKKNVSVKVRAPLTEAEQSLLDEVMGYINENRVRAVASKQTYDTFGKLQGDVVRDALDEHEQDSAGRATDTEEWKVISKHVGSLTAQIVRPVWIDIHA